MKSFLSWLSIIYSEYQLYLLFWKATKLNLNLGFRDFLFGDKPNLGNLNQTESSKDWKVRLFILKRFLNSEFLILFIFFKKQRWWNLYFFRGTLFKTSAGNESSEPVSLSLEGSTLQFGIFEVSKPKFMMESSLSDIF